MLGGCAAGVSFISSRSLKESYRDEEMRRFARKMHGELVEKRETRNIAV